MLYKLHPSQFFAIQPLIEPLDEHLCISSFLSGATAGQIYADDPLEPAAAFIAVGARVFLAGKPDRPAFLAHLHQLLHKVVVPQAKAAGQEAFTLHLSGTQWEEHMPALLHGFDPRTYPRQCYEARGVKEDWRALLPDGFALLSVTADLLDKGYANISALRQEMCSERPSVQDFLARSFGVCIVHGDALVGWCLSEYNTGDRCEVGIATNEAYRRLGLGTAAALAMAEEAFARGYRRIGWHCWRNNRPSALLALRAGFKLVSDFPVWLCYWEAKPVHTPAC